MMYIKQAQCMGCGACVESCPSGALSVYEGKAQIDARLCNSCGSCVDACPNGAIATAVPALAPDSTLTRPSAPLPSAAPALRPTVEKQMVQPTRRATAPALGAALAFLGYEIAPRVASAVVETILRHAGEATPSPRVQCVRNGHPRRRRRGAKRASL
jgi:NAD-dependent dihydropyrimidine dehydrogenase PreA subunit